MKPVLLLIMVVSSATAFAQPSLAPFPSGFAQTRITFNSSAHANLDFARQWYCATIQFIQQERMPTLNNEVKASLVKPLKFGNSICDNEKFVGLPGASHLNEKVYLDFQTLDHAQFFLSSAVQPLGSNDDIVGGVQLLRIKLNELRVNWITAQTGYSPNSFPQISDQTKFSWTTRVNEWVNAAYALITE